MSFPNAQCYSGQTAAEGCTDGIQNLSGQPLNRAPDATFDLGAKYEIRIASAWKAALTLDGAHSSSYQAESDYGPGGQQVAFWRLNSAAHVSSADDHWDFAVIGRNLTNSYYLISASSLPATPSNEFLGTFGRPREVLLEAQYHFSR